MTPKKEMKRTGFAGSTNNVPITAYSSGIRMRKTEKHLPWFGKGGWRVFGALLLSISLLAGLWSVSVIPVTAADSHYSKEDRERALAIFTGQDRVKDVTAFAGQNTSCANAGLTNPAAAGFTDIKGKEWYAADVLALAGNSNGIIKGYPDGSFRANAKLTIDQFITMLVRAGGETAANHAEYWAIHYLNKAKEMGILQDGDFADFRAEISREEMALLMIRFLAGREDISNVNTNQAEEAIVDFALVGAYQKTTPGKERYQKAVKEAYVLGLLTGYEDTSFQPQGILTRAEAATVIVRLLNPNRRAVFQPEVMKQKQAADLANHYYGGSKWVNPADESIPKLIRVREDQNMTKGGLDYSPSVKDVINNALFNQSADEIDGLIEYTNEGMKRLGQLEDIENLLLRRVPKAEAEKVMQYLRKKTNAIEHLGYRNVDFFLDNDRYLVRFREVRTMINSNETDFDGNAYYVGFNIWYMDTKWQKLYKESYDFDYPKIR